MSDLLASLSMAARSLEAQRMGLEVTGQNIANVNTPGYSRRQVELVEVPPYEMRSAGNGVDAVAIRAIRDQLLEYRLRQEQPAEQRYGTIADGLSIVEVALGKPGESIDGRLSALFDAFANLAEAPLSMTARQNVLLQGRQLADGFHDMAFRLDSARRDADTQVRSTVDEINALASRIATLNSSIARAGGQEGVVLHLKDEQATAVRELSALIDVDVLTRDDGGIDVTFGNGRPLAIGENSYALQVGSDPSGYAELRSDGTVVTSEITGGQISGFLELRDQLLPSYQSRLDDLAFEVAGEVNAIHQTGYDLNGVQAGLFFAPLAGPAGAARAIAVDSTLAADPALLAASATGAAGDNGIAKSLAGLRDARVLGGGVGTLVEGWADLVYRVGQDSAVARQEQEGRAEIVRQIDALRDAVSGVSLDEEAMMLMRFQRAYEANAKFFQTIDTALDTLLGLVR